MNLYDKVKKLLELYPEARNSDKFLVQKFWQMHDGVFVSIEDIMKATSSESITRARRKAQEQHHELRASKEIFEQRKLRQDSNGQFIFE
jgi:hypothetical protein